MLKISTTSPTGGRKILNLIPYNDPLLRVQAETVKFPLSLEDVGLIDDMLYSVEDTQLATAKAPWPSAAGMAAPQWGVSRRIFVIRRQYIEDNHSNLDGNDDFIIVINPEYTGITQDNEVRNTLEDEKRSNQRDYSCNSLEESSPKEVEDWEGCFSVPYKKGKVKRFHSIKATFSNVKGTPQSFILTGWAARVFQHETDHTEGRLYDDVTASRCIQLVADYGSHE